MKFTYSAFIENTPEMREWLEKLGYKSSVEFDAIECSLPYLVTIIRNNDPAYLACSLNDGLIWEDDIDCRSNPSLFKAVTAIREDSDYMQWLVCTVSLSDCATCKGEFVLSYERVFQTSRMDGSFWRKATLSELQEYFKTKQP